MKRFIAFTLATVTVALTARAQWIVYDPTVHTTTILNGVQEIAKFVEVINNQMQQIQTLTDQLNEFKHYEELFGDPRAVVLSTVRPLVSDLRKTELGQTFIYHVNTAAIAPKTLINAAVRTMRTALPV